MGEWVRPTEKGVYLTITESVSPYAVGKYNGPDIEIYLKSELARVNLLQIYQQHLFHPHNVNDLLDEASFNEFNQLDRIYDFGSDVSDLLR